MDRPPIADGAVAFAAGRVVDVGDARGVIARHPGAAVEDLGDALLLPGLVNPHTHLELSNCEPLPGPAGEFTDWILALRGRAGFDAGDDAGTVTRAVGRGVADCLTFGVTTVGDVTRLSALTRPLLAASPLNVVSYGEVLAIAAFRDAMPGQLDAACDPAFATDRLTVGVTPHAPYTVEPDGYRACLDAARRLNLPLTTHLAELPYEAEFLSDHAGPFRDLLDRLGKWSDGVPRFDGGPVRFAASVGLLDFPALLAHVNYCDDAELALLAAGRASVVYCPRTHAAFGHPPHRWREMLAAGINVCVGTDSLASSPSLNLVDDLRLLRRLAPDVPALDLWSMATTRAAAAVGQSADVGSLAPGSRADAVAFAATAVRGGADPLADGLDDPDGRPTGVWVGGDRMVRKE